MLKSVLLLALLLPLAATAGIWSKRVRIQRIDRHTVDFGEDREFLYGSGSLWESMCLPESVQDEYGLTKEVPGGVPGWCRYATAKEIVVDNEEVHLIPADSTDIQVCLNRHKTVCLSRPFASLDSIVVQKPRITSGKRRMIFLGVGAALLLFELPMLRQMLGGP